MTDYGRLRHQQEIRADCIECGGNRTFSSVGADPDAGIVYYECDAQGCTHRLQLDMDP